jgi:hypothetical protein
MRNSSSNLKLWKRNKSCDVRNEKFNKSYKNIVDNIISRQDQAEERWAGMENKLEKLLHSDNKEKNE